MRDGDWREMLIGIIFVTGLFCKFKEKVNETEGIGYC